jgi:hypothetical protein
MNKSQKDFEKAITLTEKQFIQYQNDFGWSYIKDKEVVSGDRYHIVFFTNKMTSTVIKFNSEHGILDVASIGNSMIKKLVEMQTKLEGNH